MRPVGARKKAKKERKETQRCDKLPICSDHPCRATPTKFLCGVRSRTLSYILGFIEIGSGFSAPRVVKIRRFLMALWHYGFHNRLGLYRPTCDLNIFIRLHPYNGEEDAYRSPCAVFLSVRA